MNALKAIGLFVLRQFGIGRRKPTTRLGRYARRTERAMSAAVLVYVGFLAFPQMLFAYNVSAKGVTIYSRAPLPAETTARIDEALALTSQSELAVQDRHERIFICNNPWLFRFFAPLSAHAFANSWPVTDNIFVADADLTQNVSLSSAPAYNRRSFSAVAAHEITHGLIRHRVGLLRALTLPAWISEGYCDYVARESSFPESDGLQRLRSGKDDASASFQYFVYRQMVRHLVDDRNTSFDQLIKAGDAKTVRAETVRALEKEAGR
jgi:hypothetical protein